MDVYFAYHKYDGTLHWNATLRLLGEDEHGVWLGGAPDAWRKGQAPAPLGFAHTLLVPRAGWFTASFNQPTTRWDTYIDVTTVPVWTSPTEVTTIDLDLDVVRWRETGAVEIIDEDEFAEHQVALGYPPEIVAGARRSADELAAVVAAGAEPFVRAYRPWLERVWP